MLRTVRLTICICCHPGSTIWFRSASCLWFLILCGFSISRSVFCFSESWRRTGISAISFPRIWWSGWRCSCWFPWSGRMDTHCGRQFFQGTMSLPYWWSWFTPRILLRMYFRVFMYLIRLPCILRYDIPPLWRSIRGRYGSPASLPYLLYFLRCSLNSTPWSMWSVRWDWISWLGMCCIDSHSFWQIYGRNWYGRNKWAQMCWTGWYLS